MIPGSQLFRLGVLCLWLLPLAGCNDSASDEELGEVLTHMPKIPGTEVRYHLPAELKSKAKSAEQKTPADSARPSPPASGSKIIPETDTETKPADSANIEVKSPAAEPAAARPAVDEKLFEEPAPAP